MNKFFVSLVVCWIGGPALLWAQSAGQKSDPREENDLSVLRGLRQVAVTADCKEVFRRDLGFLDNDTLRNKTAARLKKAGIDVVPEGPGIPLLFVSIEGDRHDTPVGPFYLFEQAVFLAEFVQLQRGDKSLMRAAVVWASSLEGGGVRGLVGGKADIASLEKYVLQFIDRDIDRFVAQWRMANRVSTVPSLPPGD